MYTKYLPANEHNNRFFNFNVQPVATAVQNKRQTKDSGHELVLHRTTKRQPTTRLQQQQLLLSAQVKSFAGLTNGNSNGNGPEKLYVIKQRTSR